jgi:hypothetical protein
MAPSEAIAGFISRHSLDLRHKSSVLTSGRAARLCLQVSRISVPIATTAYRSIFLWGKSFHSSAVHSVRVTGAARRPKSPVLSTSTNIGAIWILPIQSTLPGVTSAVAITEEDGSCVHRIY